MPPHPCSHLLIECKMAVSWLCMCVLLSASLSAFAMPDEDLDNAVGLIESVDVSDEGVQIAASFACQNNNYNLLEVLKAERQVEYVCWTLRTTIHPRFNQSCLLAPRDFP